MQDELWQQWRSFAALWAPMGPDGQAGSASPGSFGFASFIDAAERFKAAAQSFLESAAAASAPVAAQAAQSFSDFLRDQFAEARLPWGELAGAGGADRVSQPWFADWPALGPMREHQQRWQRMAEAGRRIDEAQRRLQRLWSDALRQAATEFAARLQPPLPAAADAEALRKLYDSWIDCAEDAYARIAHSAAFCDAQAELVNALSHWRDQLRAGIEHASKLLDLPTRSEINTLARRLKAVEAQLRAATPGEPDAGPEPRGRRPAARKASAAGRKRAGGKSARKAGR